MAVGKTRMMIAHLCEQATQSLLIGLKHLVARFDQSAMTDDARRALRQTKDPARWIPDFIVTSSDIGVVYVDAKYANAWYDNYSVEMRSLLTTKLSTTDTCYVCSKYWDSSGQFADFKAIKASDVPTHWACCSDCRDIFVSEDPLRAMVKLPDHCIRAKNKIGSGTPYFVIPISAFPDFDPLGISTRPLACVICGGQVDPETPIFPNHAKRDIHPACWRWPNTGRIYGPDRPKF